MREREVVLVMDRFFGCSIFGRNFANQNLLLLLFLHFHSNNESSTIIQAA